ncbi:unnamed protein product, partial [marine sediment metagenome]
LNTMELALLENYSQVYELKDVEVFGIGTWKGNKITGGDLDNIINGTNEIIDKLKPRVKLGHNDKQELLKKTGLPAGGWITKLKRAGDKILVDIKSPPVKPGQSWHYWYRRLIYNLRLLFGQPLKVQPPNL